ncbi:MAG: type II toxin-antitoxin system VapB family antitoxin [Sphingomonadaceae bacterium]|nr:type II toxin-antitoxin system VapB family antitoxin [Sphingomonadaceae bacterium]
MSGIDDRDLLLEKALSELIQREAGRRLIEMGGTMPDFEPAPRERPFP